MWVTLLTFLLDTYFDEWVLNTEQDVYITPLRLRGYHGQAGWKGFKIRRIGRRTVVCCLLTMAQPLQSEPHRNCGDLRWTLTRLGNQQSVVIQRGVEGPILPCWTKLATDRFWGTAIIYFSWVPNRGAHVSVRFKTMVIWKMLVKLNEFKTAIAKQRKIECETGALGRRGGKIGVEGDEKSVGL